MREFELLGYTEMFREKGKTKMLGSRRLSELPEGRKLSIYGEVEVTFPKGTVLTLCKTTTNYEWTSKGQTLISTILPINGRLLPKK